MREKDAVEVSIDRFGRVVIPKPIRDDLGLRGGDLLRCRRHEGGLMISVVEASLPLVEDGKLLVYRGEALDDLSSEVERLREERSRHLSEG